MPPFARKTPHAWEAAREKLPTSKEPLLGKLRFVKAVKLAQPFGNSGPAPSAEQSKSHTVGTAPRRTSNSSRGAHRNDNCAHVRDDENGNEGSDSR